MADKTDSVIPTDTNIDTSATASSFLDAAPSSVASTTTKAEDVLYNDFFQENSSGELTVGGKKERSGLEIAVSVMQYVATLIVIVWILFGLHVFIRSSSSGSFFESYPFLCPYLHYDIGAPANEKWCKNIDVIQREYSDKQKILEDNIITALTEYIPIKVSSSILDASPEKKFIVDTYEHKPHVNNVLEAFEKVKSNSQSVNGENIKCNGLTVTEWSNLSTQCTIYGGAIGDADTNGQIGSARIQALHFIENLGDTSKSSLILDNEPTSLGIENIPAKEAQTLGFATRTTLPIQVRYVPLVQKF